jgi:hypothetical protein
MLHCKLKTKKKKEIISNPKKYTLNKSIYESYFPFFNHEIQRSTALIISSAIFSLAVIISIIGKQVALVGATRLTLD